MIRLIYTLILTFASPLLLLSLYKKKPDKPSVGSRWKEHFGHTPKLNNPTSSPIWIHAVSVGEVIAISPLIRKLKQLQPNTNIVLTTTTPTGAEQVTKLGTLVEHRYMPLDFGFAVTGFIKAIRPQALYIVETELWPNTLHKVAQAKIPISVINARLSERSFQRYAKFQPLFDLVSKNLTKVLCQYQDDAERFVRLGVDVDKVCVTGSIKFDIQIEATAIIQGEALRKKFNQRPVWIAASTHEGEDLIICEAHRAILRAHPNALLILVPRHPERFKNVAQLVNQQGCNVVTRTSGQAILPHIQVYLADTMGEMMIMMSAADICFMGGSLVGDKVGGHNLLEPAEIGIPMLIGPSYFNFKDITEHLISIGACQVADTPDTIAEAVINLMASETKRIKQGQSAKTFMAESKGAVDRTIEVLGLNEQRG